MALLALFCLVSWPSSADELVKTEVQLSDDGWVEVKLDMVNGFPFYGKHFFTSFMFTNGVVGFLEPTPVDATDYSYINDGFCCNGYDFAKTNNNYGSGGATRFNYIISPLMTDLIAIGNADKFYVAGNKDQQSYYWSASEYYNAENTNTFDLTIYKDGDIKSTYTELNIKNHNASINVIGDYAQGEYEMFYFHNKATSDGLYWNTDMTEPVNIDTGASICTTLPDLISCAWQPADYAANVYANGCAASALYDFGCAGYQAAYIDNQCLLDSLYSPTCSGYQDELLLTEITIEPEEIYSEEEVFEEIYIPIVIETFIETMIEQPELMAEVYTELLVLPDYGLNVEATGSQLMIAEIEAEIESFMSIEMQTSEPLDELEMPDLEPLEVESTEAIEQPVEVAAEIAVAENDSEADAEIEAADNEEIEEETEVAENEESEQEEQEVEIAANNDEKDDSADAEVAVVAVKKEKTTKDQPKTKEQSRRDKIKQIIKNKMMSLAADLGNAASIEQQAQIQNYIVALIGFNEFYDVNQIITDGQFYADRDIYGNIAMPVNKKARRMGLIDQLKFNEMVEQQYKEL